MTAKSRYWDHERCCWVAYDRDEAVPAAVTEALPEQRADAPATAPAAPTTGS